MCRLENEFDAYVLLFLLLGGPVVILGAYYLWHGVGQRKRRNALIGRPMCSPDDWFAQYLPELAGNYACVLPLLEALEEELGVDWTQLRPGDTFEKEFAVDRKYGAGDGRELLIAVYSDLCTGHRIPRDIDVPVIGGTLRDFLLGVAEAIWATQARST